MMFGEYLTLGATAASLAMDAFSVSICIGLCHERLRLREALIQMCIRDSQSYRLHADLETDRSSRYPHKGRSAPSAVGLAEKDDALARLSADTEPSLRHRGEDGDAFAGFYDVRKRVGVLLVGHLIDKIGRKPDTPHMRRLGEGGLRREMCIRDSSS